MKHVAAERIWLIVAPQKLMRFNQIENAQAKIRSGKGGWLEIEKERVAVGIVARQELRGGFNNTRAGAPMRSNIERCGYPIGPGARTLVASKRDMNCAIGKSRGSSLHFPWLAEQRRNFAYPAFRKRCSHSARRANFPGPVAQRVDWRNLKSVTDTKFTEQIDISLASAAEAVILTNDDMARRELIDKNLGNKVFR